MASLDLLPATTYTPPPPVQVHRRRRSLNTIIEDDEGASKEGTTAKEPQGQDESRLAKWLSPMSDHFPTPRARDESQKTDWFSPMSDHFPTPRGKHFMSAPIIPASPSSVTDSDSEYSQSSSAPWNSRDSFATQATDLGDIYDASSDEEKYQKRPSKVGLTRTSSKRLSKASKHISAGSVASRISLPTLIIPDSDEQWGPPTFKYNSPIPPTPPPKLPMSPAVFQYLAAQEVLSSSATPSLDGSLSSEQMTAMSAPPTPNMGSGEHEDGDNWGGVQLQPGALATLQALSGDDLFEQQTEQVIEISQMSPTREMQQSPPPVRTNIHRHNSVVLPPEQQRSLNSLSKLDIPSPGGFFASLSPGSRYTWDVPAMKQEAELPPSSTTAEHFYKTPWTCPISDRIVEVSEVMSDGCPTARPSFIAQSSDETIRGVISPEPSVEEIVATEILADYDDDYLRTLKDAASENLDRTSMWLTAQTSYLSALINPPEERDDENALEKRHTNAIANNVESSPSPVKKTVRFSTLAEINTTNCPLPKLGRQESAYYRSFQNFSSRSRFRDIYVHRVPRFEALQTLRVSFPTAHRNYLLGKYQLSVVPMSEKKKRQSGNVARGDETPEEDLERLKSDKEFEAMEQMRFATWSVMAVKMLNGGRLIAAPVAKRLARLSRMGPTAAGRPRDRARILDLGGQATCDWAWHCATEYPNTKVYTVTTKAIRQLSNSNIRGPKNHRRVAVEKLTKLPFNDNHFDVISARSLYAILKVSSENGEDEYDACLKECMRCLKPGGYLDFSLLDSDIVNAGPRGQAKSVEFGFSLKTRGYDPSPTKAWLGRLGGAGFVGIKRAWMFLPMGSPLQNAPVSRDSMGVELPLELEAMVTGSTNAVASITGLVGSWAWEKWMLKLEMECGKSEDSLLEGMHNIIEEGRKCGAGWRNLNGWARKPLTK